MGFLKGYLPSLRDEVKITYISVILAAFAIFVVGVYLTIYVHAANKQIFLPPPTRDLNYASQNYTPVCGNNFKVPNCFLELISNSKGKIQSFTSPSDFVTKQSNISRYS